jgi:hypothetical protein
MQSQRLRTTSREVPWVAAAKQLGASKSSTGLWVCGVQEAQRTVHVFEDACWLLWLLLHWYYLPQG